MIISLISIMPFLVLNPGLSHFSIRLSEMLSQHEYFNMGISYRGHHEPFIARVENDYNLGILYLTKEADTFAYNYVRYDTLGNMILDLKKIRTTKQIVGSNLETLELEIPNCDYCMDEDGNLWLFYVDGPSVTKKYLSWIMVDRNGKIKRERHTDIVVHTRIKSVPSKQSHFHLFLPPFGWLANSYFRYYNPGLEAPVRLCRIVDKQRFYVEPFSAFSVAHLTDDRLLVASCDVYPPFKFRYFTLNKSGVVEMQAEGNPIESCAYSKVENHGMVFNIDVFHQNDSVYVGVSISTPWLKDKVEAFYLVKFDSEGNLYSPEEPIKTGVLCPIEKMPRTIIPSIVLSTIHGIHRIWYYGCDSEGNLYLEKWNETK